MEQSRIMLSCITWTGVLQKTSTQASCSHQVTSDMDREWQKRRNEFNTIGYRDGIIAGKEDAAQEGFNIGFKESVFIGYKWGSVRGITRYYRKEYKTMNYQLFIFDV
ncbi:hypothetical protein ACJIZ3_018578 [Penstemon smallii]|uniref:Essential protein Yae1 N-terminal domain-containing protein n=1 Tax=Penstemon smallii TaxID=265156 RepID=A0ABD3SYP4_9LAMI